MSAQSIPLLTITLVASEDIRTRRFVSPMLTEAADDQDALGVAGRPAAAGEPLGLHLTGTVLVEAGAAISQGDRVASDAQGRAVSVDDVTHTNALGMATEDASGAGEPIEVVLFGYRGGRPAARLTASGPVEARHFVAASGAVAGENADTVGVSAQDASDGGPLTVIASGPAVVIAGDAVTVGVALASDSQGRAVPIDGVTYTTKVARALSAAAQAGDLIQVVVIPN